jgi:hypothetical protein
MDEETNKIIKKVKWNKIKRVICEEQDKKIKNEIMSIINNKKIISYFRKDKKKARIIFEDKIILERDETHANGSCKGERTAFGVWKEKGERKEAAYQVNGTQNAYNGELQEVIFGVNTAPPNSVQDIKSDNSAVISIANKIKKGEFINWGKIPEPELIRMLKDGLE